MYVPVVHGVLPLLACLLACMQERVPAVVQNVVVRTGSRTEREP